MVTQKNTDPEGYKGLGRSDRRRMKRRWREEASDLSLKEWAAQQGVGDMAEHWLRKKRSQS